MSHSDPKTNFVIPLFFCLIIVSCEFSTSGSRSFNYSFSTGSTAKSNTVQAEYSSRDENGVDHYKTTSSNAYTSDGISYEISSETRYDHLLNDTVDSVYVAIETMLKINGQKWKIELFEEDLRPFIDFTGVRKFGVTKVEYHPQDDADFMALTYHVKTNADQLSVYIPFELKDGSWIVKNY